MVDEEPLFKPLFLLKFVDVLPIGMYFNLSNLFWDHTNKLQYK